MKIKKYLFAILMLFLLIVVGCSSETKEEPPEAIVKINDENIETAKGTYQWETKGLFSNRTVNADAAAPFQIAEDMKAKIVEQSSVANIKFNDGSQPQLHAYLWEEEKRGEELPLNQHQITLPSEKGKYVIEINAVWSNGDSSYTFVIEVQ
ncbi:hypothetical protein F9802_02700 [Bacillus aerolatus]|uniref:Lipoprotein n=1 Tax=Bacillus aerolatus TaxID=2653354 RepID=A0A6I1FK55_9BACI|nr:hypothetical protein [Bacillus aerolatus]KAB7709055.1 hypothetical protein F9802_02700 [Bacillus aerolatus]